LKVIGLSEENKQNFAARIGNRPCLRLAGSQHAYYDAFSTGRRGSEKTL